MVPPGKRASYEGPGAELLLPVAMLAAVLLLGSAFAHVLDRLEVHYKVLVGIGFPIALGLVAGILQTLPLLPIMLIPLAGGAAFLLVATLSCVLVVAHYWMVACVLGVATCLAIDAIFRHLRAREREAIARFEVPVGLRPKFAHLM